MTDTRPPKKSETLEVRLPFETKREFLDACREDGTTASAVVRATIERHLDQRRRPEAANDAAKPAEGLTEMTTKSRTNWRYLAGAAGAAGLAALVVLPSAAAPDFSAVFKRLDLNKDGVLTADEFAAPLDGHEVVMIKRQHTADGATAPPADARPGVTDKAVAFYLGDDGAHTADGGPVIQRRAVRIIRKDGDNTPLPALDISKREFERFDGDKDGKVSMDEFAARHREMLANGFAELDGDKDGSLSQAEYLKMAQPLSVIGAAIPDDEKAKIKIETLSAPNLEGRFIKLDANKDGKLSLEEYLSST